MKPTVTITGIDDVNRILEDVGPRQAHNLMRSTIHGIAGEMRKESRRLAPKDEGDLKRSIKAKRERAPRGKYLSTVRVAPKAFYWRFLEYGQGPDNVEHAFFMKTVEKFRPKLNDIFVQQFGKKWEAALVRAARRNGG